MNVLEHRDRIRVAHFNAGDPPGMGRDYSLSQLFGVGGGRAPADSRLSLQEQPGIRLTKLVLTSFPVAVTSITTGAGVGGSLIYTFPEGYIQRYYARALLNIGVQTQTAFTDGTPEGDIGIGSAAPADADALGTDATDDDWGTATAFTMTAFAVSNVAVPPEAAAVVDGSSTPAELYLNALVDAADINDGVTTNLLFTGSIWITWGYLGDA